MIDVENPDKPTPQKLAYESEAEILLYGGAAGGGKLLNCDEVLPTLDGYVTVRDVKTGDKIFDEAGSVCSVVAVSPIENNPVSYRITFDDKTTIEACADHRWLTFNASELSSLTRRDPEWRANRRAGRTSRAGNKKSDAFSLAISSRNAANPPPSLPPPPGTVRTTQEIFDTLRTPGGRANHAIPVAMPLQIPDADLPIDPYVLGAWLGDGSSAGGGFTSVDPEICEQIASAGYEVRHSEKDKQHHHICGLVTQLRKLCLTNNKHVPPIYLRGSEEQRRSLFQGLMDTDGCCNFDAFGLDHCPNIEGI